MLAVGLLYREERHCTFPAVTYLLVGGSLGVVLHGVDIMAEVANWCAERDGITTRKEAGTC